MAKYRLGDIAPVKQGIVPDSDQYWLLNLDAVESNTGNILEYVYVDYSQIGASTVSFNQQNVLYSKLRPYLNKVVLPDRAGYATSEMLPLMPNEKVITREYLTFFLRSPHFVEYINGKTSGAKMPRANTADLKAVEMECPPINEQNRIVSQINSILTIIAHRKNELSRLDELIRARFVEMFGDPLIGTEKFLLHTVGDVAEAIDPQPSHRTPPIDENGIPYVSIKDCDYKTGRIDFDNARKVGRSVLEDHRNRYTLHDGDFIIGKIGTIGNPVFVPARDDYTLSANIVLVQPNHNKVSPYFLKYSFMSAYMDRQFEEAKNSTSQAAFGIQKVRQIKVMNPDLIEQYRFEMFAKQVDKSKSVVQKSLDKMQLLFDSLMQQYFG